LLPEDGNAQSKEENETMMIKNQHHDRKDIAPCGHMGRKWMNALVSTCKFDQAVK
jgi:hypothetical protein